MQHVTASNAIVSASGMSEAMAKGLSDEFLGELPTGSKVTPPPSVYVGGGSSEHSTSSCTAVVAFESPGWSDMKKAMLSTVVRHLCPYPCMYGRGAGAERCHHLSAACTESGEGQDTCPKLAL